MSRWPLDTSMEAFRQAWTLEGEPFWLSVFEMHRDKMQIKNPKVAVGNLEKIFSATFDLANSKGFQAMSLRDLSKETGISMGGLYAYIGSKADLAAVIEGVLRRTIEQVIGSLTVEKLDPVARLRAIVFGELYMVDILSPWYYFCFMELKGLERSQQQQAMDLELRFESLLIEAFAAGQEQGGFGCSHPELLAAQVTAQLQEWHLKQWKFKQRQVSLECYGQFVLDSLLSSLQAASAEPGREPEGKLRQSA